MDEPRRRLRRLDRVFSRSPVYFITTVVSGRRAILGKHEVQHLFEEVWGTTGEGCGWSTGPYVIMPDHVHFFCRESAESSRSLSGFVGKWKEWTSKRLHREFAWQPPLWQTGFFDHVLRSDESLREKIEYVWQNPVRAELVGSPEQWPFRGNPGNWGVRDGS